MRDDPFFQLVKNSRVAREMMVPAGGDFNADTVIEAALRQEFGPDHSMSAAKENIKLRDDSHTQPVWEYKKKYRDRNPIMGAEHLFAGGQNFYDRQQRLEDHAKEKPATFINRPLTRGQLRRRVMRSVKKDEIEWRNIPFLVKFINDSGKLLNRYQTRMETSVQRKLARTIKKIRNLQLIPFQGRISPTDKIPIGSYIDEIEEMHKRTIDPVTGRIFLRHNLNDDMRDKERRKKQRANYRSSDFANYAIEETEEQEELRNTIIREMTIDQENMVPNAAQRELQSA